MVKKSQPKTKVIRKEKPRIAVQLQQSGIPMAEFIRVAKERNWQIYDLSINNFHLPTNPPPSGAIISSRYGSTNSRHYGRRFEFPTVRLGKYGHKTSKAYPTVLSDMFAAGRLAIDYFHEEGYQNVLVIHQSAWKGVSPIYKGAADRAEELDISLHRVRQEHLTGETHQEKLDRWAVEVGDTLAKLPRPLAYLGASDYLASRFCFNCEALGLSVPEDIAVMGISNNTDTCEASSVPISSIDLNRSLMLEEACALLERIMSGEPAPKKPILIPPKGVVVRRSTEVLAVEDPRVARALRFMWDHFAWPITVDDVANDMGLNRRTLGRLFSQHLGRGVKEELTRKRLEECCRLLRSTDLSIQTISKTVGIPSQPYLQRIFLKAFGITPGKYRAEQASKHAEMSQKDN